MSEREITIIDASAGTGKTTRLASEYVRIFSNNSTRVSRSSVEESIGVIATTFSRKAAQELLTRVRTMLLDRGHWLQAQYLLCGYAGTVHSLALRLVCDYALEAGLSPMVRVIDEIRRESVFATAAEPALAVFGSRCEAALHRLQWSSWQEEILRACYLATENGVTSEQLLCASNSSSESLLALLAPPEVDTDLSVCLRQAIVNAVATVATNGDCTLQTKKAIQRLELSRRALASDSLTWPEWAAIAKLSVGAKSKSALSKVCEHAGRHSSHPQLRADLQLIIDQFFLCVANALQQYNNYKIQRGLVDYSDLEMWTLRLLAQDTVRSAIKDQLRVMLIDEFQDTSPVQLKLFQMLSCLAGESIWAGDEKQSIYGFRGTDPSLIARTSAVLAGKRERLTESYRSRIELVDFCNDLFGEAFGTIGIPEERVRIEHTHKKTSDEQTDPISVWWLRGAPMDSVVQGIHHILHESPLLVVDQYTAELRKVRGSDIAVLFATNDHCEQAAQALDRAGQSSSCERPGLLRTPEVILALACFRYLVDRRDSLALAEIIHLRHGYSTNWLDIWLRDGSKSLEHYVPETARLKDGAANLITWTPAEALDFAISAGGVLSVAKSWGHYANRTANLDALRGLAWQYEEHCRITRKSCTASGLVAYLSVVDEEKAIKPASTNPDSICISTFHAAKGLEWPVVVLCDLHKPQAATIFGIHMEREQSSISIDDPLEGRWLRFWPWPYGTHSTNMSLADRAAETPEMKRAEAQRVESAIRLLYVGMTRAREYLILAPRADRSNTGWLDLLRTPAGENLLELPREIGSQKISIKNREHEISVKEYCSEADAESGHHAINQEVVHEYPGLPRQAYAPYRIAPSSLSVDACSEREKTPPIYSIGDRVSFASSVDIEALGNALHRFFAADRLGPYEERLELACDVLRRWGIVGIREDDILTMNDRLHRFLTARYGKFTAIAECPVTGRLNNQRVNGRIDLLLKCEEGYVVLDHKSFPGPYALWIKKALSFRSQLNIYRQIVLETTKKPVIDCLIHLPVVGKIVLLVDHDSPVKF